MSLFVRESKSWILYTCRYTYFHSYRTVFPPSTSDRCSSWAFAARFLESMTGEHDSPQGPSRGELVNPPGRPVDGGQEHFPKFHAPFMNVSWLCMALASGSDCGSLVSCSDSEALKRASPPDEPHTYMLKVAESINYP